VCTAVSYRTKCHYFGRNLDLECSYGEEIVITPRNFPLVFRCGRTLERHHAIIGVAHVAEGYPLYYDAANERGLAMAGLNFPHSARYGREKEGMDNIASFELMVWVLGQCDNCDQAEQLMGKTNLTDTPFSPQLPPAPLHWMIADGSRTLVAEPLEDGLKLYDAPVGVLTNEPPFPAQMEHLARYLNLGAHEPSNRLLPGLELKSDSRGTGAVGLPGDLSSASRFVRGAFTKWNSVCGGSEEESVSQFFHILGSVAQRRGCVRLSGGELEITRYSTCCNTDRGIWYYTTYENSAVTGVDLRRENLEENRLLRWPMEEGLRVRIQNG